MKEEQAKQSRILGPKVGRRERQRPCGPECGLSEFPLGASASIFPLKTSGQAYEGGDGSGKVAAALLD